MLCTLMQGEVTPMPETGQLQVPRQGIVGARLQFCFLFNVCNLVAVSCELGSIS
jgi:hypothetical protein